jgi:hypothetical protein
MLEYVEGVGFFITQNSTSPALRTFRLASNYTNSTTTTTEVTGLSQATGIGTFIFEYYILHSAGATTTGFRASVNHTGTVTQFVYWIMISSATTTASDGVQDQDISLVTGGLLNVNAARAKGTGGLMGGAAGHISVDTASADMLTCVQGLAIVTVDGDLELWWASEVAALTTVQAGSALRITQIG